MTGFLDTHLPCPCGKSSDAYSIYLSGVGHCFSCGKSFAPDGTEAGGERVEDRPTDLLTDLEYVPLEKRGVSQEACKAYGYGIATLENGERRQVAQFFDHRNRVIAQKVRNPDKTFYWLGDKKRVAGLFGQQMARTAGRMIVITEGELDALSVYDVLGRTWPVLSVPDGATSAARSIQQQLDFLEQYEKVVLCFDSDEAGREATAEVVELFSPGKVATVDLGGYKDANDMLKAGAGADLRAAVWNAQVWRPDGIVNLADLKDRIAAPLSMGTLYPWQGLNDMLYGFRPKELITWTAGTGAGKTALVSELVYSLILSGERVGIVYLEEGVDRSGKRIVGLRMDKPIHLPGVDYSEEEFDTAWDDTLGRGNLLAYDHFGSLDSDVLLNRIRYMVKGMGCRVVVLDHISMVVSGTELDADERRILDRTATKLASLCQEANCTIHMVSHLRRPQGTSGHEEGRHVSLMDLRGTQAIAQLSHAVIGAERDQQAEDEAEKNTTTLRVLKNRYAGLTGVACRLHYNHATGRLNPVNEGTEAFANADYA